MEKLLMRKSGVNGPEPGRRRRFSTLTLRILAPNLLALGVFIVGIFYLDQLRTGLLKREIVALQNQAEVLAGALGASALTGPENRQRLQRNIAAQIIRRSVVPAPRTRARLYQPNGRLLVDSRDLVGVKRKREYQQRHLPPANFFDRTFSLIESPLEHLQRLYHGLYDWLFPLLPSYSHVPPYRERPGRDLEDYPELQKAQKGEITKKIRALKGRKGLILLMAVPVRHANCPPELAPLGQEKCFVLKGLRRVAGTLLLSVDSTEIEKVVRNYRQHILTFSALVLTVTVLVSFFLAGTISGPVRRLARAADQVRRWRGRRAEIPDLSNRRDEIGDLSVALFEMTQDLYERLDAIEVFAADVAHEIKNPLTSMRSALESLNRTENAETKKWLTEVIAQDIQRMDRLISDISDASRIDAELAREELETFDLTELLKTAVAVRQTDSNGVGPQFILNTKTSDPILVTGLPSRLGQVVANLIGNAVSFVPPDGRIELSLSRQENWALLTVEDNGPGIQPGEEEAIFQRFYSQRPPEEDFGQHSGLGLSICRQIIKAHGGTITAKSRLNGGARFDIYLRTT